MIYGKFVTEKEDLDMVNGIIRYVFEEELGLAEKDDGEDFILSALLFAENGTEPAGAGRLLFDGERFTIGETAVLPEYRGRGYGDFLVRLLVEKAVTAGAAEIRVDATAGTESFFGEIGFVPEGEPFRGGGGLWQPMLLTFGSLRCEACQ